MLEVELNHQWLVVKQRCLHRGGSIRTYMLGSGALQGVCPEGMEVVCHPTPRPVCPFHLGVPVCIPYDKLELVNCVPGFCEQLSLKVGGGNTSDRSVGTWAPTLAAGLQSVGKLMGPATNFRELLSIE